MDLEGIITLTGLIMKGTGSMGKSKEKDFSTIRNLNLDNLLNLKGFLKMMKWLDLTGKKKSRKMQLCCLLIF